MVLTDPLIGREIDGYRVEKLLGSGGMARVYRARDENLARYVAIKIVAPHLNQELEYETRFKREARAVAQLRHQHIISVHRFGESSGLYYMAMDYIDGSDLAWVLEDYRKHGELIDYNEMLRILAPIGSALDYAHLQGVVHRDVKPSNIMLTSSGEPILTDFGLVLMKSEGTMGDVFGSPYYIAPEQAISSASAGPGSDIYSLGVIIYEMLTGSRPFDAESPMQIAMAHMTEPVPAPQSFYPELHPAFNPVLMKVLAKTPEERYTSCKRLFKDLNDAIKLARREGAMPGKVLRHASSGKLMTISSISVAKKVENFRTTNPQRALSLFEDGDTTNHVAAPAPVDGLEQSTAHTGTRQKPASTYPTTAAKPKQDQEKKRNPLPALIAAVLLIALLAAGGVFVATQVMNNETAAPPPPLTTVIQGPVSAIEDNVITVYDVAFRLPSSTPLLDGLRVGDMIWIEGSLDSDATGSEITISQVIASSYEESLAATQTAETN
ncbi:MAG: serine/threonine-protein kinase [Anaerolineae bacterium]